MRMIAERFSNLASILLALCYPLIALGSNEEQPDGVSDENKGCLFYYMRENGLNRKALYSRDPYISLGIHLKIAADPIRAPLQLSSNLPMYPTPR